MNNPYEDLEYLAEFLPEEGESVIVTRRRGQLVCESYFETHATPPAQAGLSAPQADWREAQTGLKAAIHSLSTAVDRNP